MNTSDSLQVINSNPSLHIFLFIFLLVLIFFVAFYFLKKKSVNRSGNKPITLSKQDENRIENIIDNTLKKYLEEIKKRNLYNFYSRQLDIEEYQQKYEYDYTVKKQFFDLFLNSAERKYAIKLLKRKITNIYYNKDFNLDEYDYLSFLYDYYDIIAEKKVLEDIKDKVKRRNIDPWNNYYEDINKKLGELLDKYQD